MIHRVGLLVFCLVLFPPAAFAQSSPYSLVHKFYAGPRMPSGALVEAPDGTLYGTTICGGEPGVGCDGGSIFALRPRIDGSMAFEDLHHLRPGLHGSRPSGGLTLARDGSLYGIATQEGLPDHFAWGTIFRVSPSGSLAPLYVFSDRNAVGAESPVGRLIEAADGNLYGGTCFQGAPDSRIFRVTPSGAFSTLYQFPRSIDPLVAPNGMCPVTQLHEAADGALYGTTVAGGFVPSGSSPQGTIFRLTRGTSAGSVTVLHTFRGVDGAVPTGGLAAGPPGEFFGTTAAGGAFNQGVVYRRDPTGTLQVLGSFNGSNGATPLGSLFRAAGGTLYGTTVAGGTGHGTVFRAGPSGITTLHAFSGDDGSIPVEVMRARDGSLYGVTGRGGPGGGGTIYRVGADDTFTTIHTFANQPGSPQSGVIQASDGNFYGTSEGGRLGGGTVFKLTPSGELTVLHEFAPQSPSLAVVQSIGATGLVEGPDGWLYGRTAWGGTEHRGTIYRISTSGALTVLHEFTGPDGYAGGFDGLLRASDGFFYGLTSGGLTSANITIPATLFRIDTAGNFTTVHTFSDPAGVAPAGPLVEGTDGAFYGLAFGPGSFNVGGIFRITTNGVFTALYSFQSTTEIGDRPVGGLKRGPDGFLYGMTSFRGLSEPAVYRFDPASSSVTLVAHVVLNNDAELVVAPDGSLYGWVQVPTFRRDRMRFFRIVDGTADYFYDASDADGYGFSALIRGNDGALYGTVSQGESRPGQPETWPTNTFAGGVFRLAIPAPQAK